MKHYKLHIFMTLAVMLFIFVHSAMSGDASGGESRYFAEILASLTGLSFNVAHFIVRKAAHFTEFAVLGMCLSVNFSDLRKQHGTEELTVETWEKGTGSLSPMPSVNRLKNMILKHPMIAAWIAGTMYAATDELHQLFVPGRSCELRDACIDAAGVACGIIIAAAVSALHADKR